MRLRERDKREVMVHTFTGLDDDVYTWGDTAVIRAAVYPQGIRLDQRAYGDRRKDQRLLLYDGAVKLHVGMGVSFDGGTPAFRIVSLEERSHVSAVLESIPEGARA